VALHQYDELGQLDGASGINIKLLDHLFRLCWRNFHRESSHGPLQLYMQKRQATCRAWSKKGLVPSDDAQCKVQAGSECLAYSFAAKKQLKWWNITAWAKQRRGKQALRCLKALPEGLIWPEEGNVRGSVQSEQENKPESVIRTYHPHPVSERYKEIDEWSLKRVRRQFWVAGKSGNYKDITHQVYSVKSLQSKTESI